MFQIRLENKGLTYKERHKKSSRKGNLKVYGLTSEKWDEYLNNQKGMCAICKSKFTKRPHIDHDHKTNKVRGLLCNTCNWGIGNFKDSVDILLNAISYLRGQQ